MITNSKRIQRRQPVIVEGAEGVAPDSRVYMLDCIPPHINVHDAKRFGKLYMLDMLRVNPWHSDYGERLIDALEASDYDPSCDYFLVAGKTVDLALSIAALVGEYGQVAVLLFSAAEQRYVARTIGEL